MKLLTGKKKLGQNELKERRKLEELKKELEEVQKSMDRAYQNLSYVVDPELIECCIYELNAGQMRYKFLLRQMKEEKIV